TEPASVEQQWRLGRTAPSLYDLRNLFQVNVEEARHLWAMVYLLQKYFGRDGREEAEDLLRRRSGDRDTPRLLGAFNEATPDWLSFFMFTFFTDRDGKMQLHALSQSGFDPLSRTCPFMLTEATYPVWRLMGGQIVREDAPALSSLNMRLRDDYVADAASGIERWWNRIIERAGIAFRFRLPHVAFNRRIGEFAAIHADLDGN